MSSSGAAELALPAEERPERSAVQVPLSGWRVRIALTLILGLATALRWSGLQLLPKLTDEMRDAIFSLPIARGESFPLANFSSYDGALFNYLQALLFRLVGPQLEAPRLMMLFAGLATVLLTFWCVRQAHGSGAAILAATLLALAPVHVLVNSRVAWGNNLTPLLTTAAFGLVYRATGPTASAANRGWALVPAGLLFGLALQTHPTVVCLLPGVALTFLLARPRLLRSPWPWLAVLAFALGYANMIAFNLRHDFESLQFAQQTRAEYTGATPAVGHGYADSLSTLLLGLFRMLSGAVDDRDGPTSFLTDPLNLLVAVGVLAAVIWCARRGDRLPLLVTASTVLLMPAFNDRYEPILDGRYLSPLLPLLFGAASALLCQRWRTQADAGRLRRALLMSLVLLFVVTPSLGLWRYRGQNEAAAARSARLWASLKLAVASWPPGSVALLDRDLERVVYGAGSTELLFFEWAFTLQARPYEVARVIARAVAYPVTDVGTRLVVMERAKRKLLDSTLRVRQLDGDLPERDVQPFVYGVYLITPAQR